MVHHIDYPSQASWEILQISIQCREPMKRFYLLIVLIIRIIYNHIIIFTKVISARCRIKISEVPNWSEMDGLKPINLRMGNAGNTAIENLHTHLAGENSICPVHRPWNNSLIRHPPLSDSIPQSLSTFAPAKTWTDIKIISCVILLKKKVCAHVQP